MYNCTVENRQHMLHVFCDLTLEDLIQTCLLPGGSNVLHIVQHLEMYIVYCTEHFSQPKTR